MHWHIHKSAYMNTLKSILSIDTNTDSHRDAFPYETTKSSQQSILGSAQTESLRRLDFEVAEHRSALSLPHRTAALSKQPALVCRVRGLRAVPAVGRGGRPRQGAHRAATVWRRRSITSQLPVTSRVPVPLSVCLPTAQAAPPPPRGRPLGSAGARTS